MKTRVLFGVVGAIFVLLALYVFPPIVATVAMVILSVIAAQEFTAVAAGRKSGAVQLAAMMIAALMAIASASSSTPMFWPCLVMFVAIVVLFIILLRTHTRFSFTHIAAAFFGGAVIPYLLMSLVRILTMPNGKIYILLPLLAAWGSDTCALFVGMKFGKHKLAPVVSPKKTVEGSIGGVLGAAVLSVLYAVVVHFVWKQALLTTILQYLLLGICGAVLGQIGDLSFSVVKRGSGIKDYGKIFPGHGGVLDRFDSVLFVAPAMELMIYAFAMFGSIL